MTVNRRQFLRFGAVGLLPFIGTRVPQDSTAAPLWQPGMAGRPREAVTDYQNDPFIIGVERQLRCSCGCNLDIYTCRTTDFTCTYSPELHREIVAMVQNQKTAEEIIAAFVAEYGEKALMAPPKEGFNWAGYLLPGVVISLAGVVLGWVLVRRHRAEALVPAASDMPSGLTADEDTRLQAELERLEQ